MLTWKEKPLKVKIDLFEEHLSRREGEKARDAAKRMETGRVDAELAESADEEEEVRPSSTTPPPSSTRPRRTRPSGPETVVPTSSDTCRMVNGWREVDVADSEYVPAIGTLLQLGLAFQPLPPTREDGGCVLAINAPCGRGKSFVFRAYMRRIFSQTPDARVLLMSANILYGTSLAQELNEAGFDVAFYKDKGTDLAAHRVVVCSLESLHHVKGQSFGMLLIDEIRTISTIVGGDTMQHFANLSLLQELCEETARVVVCDADLKFRVHESEPLPIVYDMMGIISTRRVLCVNLTHPGPPHLKRSARLFYNHKDAKVGKRDFLREIKRAADAWKENREHRFAVCVGSKSQLRVVSTLLEQEKVRWKPYSGETDDESKARLSDPDAEWDLFGAIVFTTTLSIGVDPKRVRFARVFIWTCRTGCNVLTQAQAAMRFGRSKAAPLLDKTIRILIDAPPPGIRELGVKEGTRKELVPPNYDSEVKKLRAMRSTKVWMWSKGLDMIGGAIKGVRQPASVSDAILRLMAHGRLERSCLQQDTHRLVMRVCQHHGWTVESPPDGGESGAGPTLDPNLLDTAAHADAVRTDADDMFAAMTTEEEKWSWCVEYVREHGEDGFFSDCYGLVQSEGYDSVLKATEKRLVRAYWLLRGIQRLPKGTSSEAQGAQLVALEKPGVHAGLHLNALRRCLEPEEQIMRDMRNRYDTEDSQRVKHPFLKTEFGLKMMAADQCAKLLGIPSMAEEADLPSRIVSIANRCTLEDRPAGDVEFVNEMRCIAHQLNLRGEKQFVGRLSDIARACGMGLKVEREKKKQTNGKRRWQIASMALTRVMPDIVDDWLVKSRRLGFQDVRTSEWASAHLNIELEALEGIEDDLLASDMFAPVESTASRDVRFEKLEAKVVHKELTRLRDLRHPTTQEQSWLMWLQAAAKASMTSKEDPSVLLLTVTYSTLACGRRTASHPSLQGCPSGLRRVVAGRFYHGVDIKNCKPTVLLEWARREQLHHLGILREAVERRGDVLRRIGDFYGTEPAKCKFVILRILSGGDEREWIREANCPRNETSTAPELEEMKECHLTIRKAMFRKHASRVESLRQQWKAKADAKVRNTLAEARAEPTSKQRRAAFEKASLKATNAAIDRSIFCLFYFEEEDRILHQMDASFRRAGWNVGSLIYDALLVEHHAEADLQDAMKAAEAVVRQTLGYTVRLHEETLFDARARASEDNFWN